MSPILAEPGYHVDKPFEIQRWMCPNCGLIFDFLDDLYGYPEADAWQNPLTGEWEIEEYCPRCKVSLNERYPIPIAVREAEIEGPVEITFFVEDSMHKLVVEEIARNAVKCQGANLPVALQDSVEWLLGWPEG